MTTEFEGFRETPESHTRTRGTGPIGQSVPAAYGEEGLQNDSLHNQQYQHRKEGMGEQRRGEKKEGRITTVSRIQTGKK